MNRIYQGRVSKVQTLKLRAKGKSPDDWQRFGLDAEHAVALKLEREKLRALTKGDTAESRAARKRLRIVNAALDGPWQKALWDHHRLFQTAVNYYTLCFAEMASGMDDPAFESVALKVAEDSARRDPKHKTDAARAKAVETAADTAKAMIAAVKSWRDSVMSTWVEGERRGRKIAGGYAEVASTLGLSVEENRDGQNAFESCATVALAGSKATKLKQAAALLQLLEEADGSDLSILVNDRLGWFCAPAGMNDKTPKSVVSLQEVKRQQQAREFRDMPESDAIARAASLDLKLFVTSPPKDDVLGSEAAAMLREYWEAAAEEHPTIAAVMDRLEAVAPDPKKNNTRPSLPVQPAGTELRLPVLGRRPSGIYPVAAVFRFVPSAETLAAFRAATASLCDGKDKQVLVDLIADSRVDDAPHFAYFTNLAFHRDPDAKLQATWKEFDHAALVEAVTSPHRYYQDTIERKKIERTLEEALQAMEGEGQGGSEDEGEGAKTALDGFRADERVDRLLTILFSDLGHLGEVDTPDDSDLSRPFVTGILAHVKTELPENSREYTLRERTLRSWHAVRDGWRDLVEKKGAPTKEDLWAIVAKEQGEHRKDFGSARFYEALTEPHNQCIWRQKGTRPYHAEDVVDAWAEYTELRRTLRDKKRPIRFTPAHATESPRFFDFPKKSSDKTSASGGKWASKHELTPSSGTPTTCNDSPGTLAFTAGIAIRDGAKWRTVMTRVSYRAPRLRRDGMRSNGEKSLDAAPWLQPMIAALGLAEPPAQDFGKCRVTLQPHLFKDVEGVERYDIQLTFPVEIETKKMIEKLGKQALWAKRFNLTPDGEKFRESTLRRKHEKQPKDPPRPLETITQSFTFGSVDFGLHADSWAMHEVRLDGQFSLTKKRQPIASRAITTNDEAPWRLATRELSKLRLPGTDATVWRKRSTRDRDQEAEFAWREELYGDCGRNAKPEETARCRDLMCALLGEQWAWEFVSHQVVSPANPMPVDWKSQMDQMLTEFSFPGQNDRLIVVARRAQSRLARIARWRAGVSEDLRWQTTLRELRDTCGFEDGAGAPPEPKFGGSPVGEQWIPVAIRDAAATNDREALKIATRAEHTRLVSALPPLLVRIANRVLPLRNRSWEWAAVSDREKEGRLHGLEQSGGEIPDVLLAGQRGLSIMRIEQIEELRRRFQSLNQAERRHHAAEQVADSAWLPEPAKKWVRRDFTDPCADLLDKLEELKTQRVNQSAHLILAQVLGVRLAKPPANKNELRKERDQHGVYEKFREPVDFVAIEDLSRYRATQGRTRDENGRLMKWCHRAVRDKLRQLCEPFGIPVLEVPAAYSSQFCSRSGVIGFRAEEVTAGFEKRAPWLFRLRVKDGEEETTEQREMRQLAGKLHEAQKTMEREWQVKHVTGVAPKVTVVLPKQGGQIFVPIVATAAQGNRFAAKITDADLNAAVNIGLRAVADPRMWEFFPRLRTERISGDIRYKGRKAKKPDKTSDATEATPTEAKIVLRAREKRKWKHNELLPELSLGSLPSGSAARETKQPNYFFDFSGTAAWDKAWIDDPEGNGRVEIASAKALFGALRESQWARCAEINEQRLKRWLNQ